MVMSMIEHTFGQKMEYFRDRAGLSKVALAEKLGVTSNYIRLVEHGMAPPPTFEKLEKIEKLLDLTEKEILALEKLAFEERLSSNDRELYRKIKRLE